MTRHLTPAEVTDALDGALVLKRLAHLDTCETCRREVEALRGLEREVTAGDEIPEPSPLFWTHLSERVSQATLDTPVAPPSRWLTWWQPLAAAAVVAVAILPFALRRAEPSTPQSVAAVQPAVAEAPSDLETGSWELVYGVASALAWDEVRQVASPRAGAADDVIERLTPQQREEFAKLLQAQIGNME